MTTFSSLPPLLRDISAVPRVLDLFIGDGGLRVVLPFVAKKSKFVDYVNDAVLE